MEASHHPTGAGASGRVPPPAPAPAPVSEVDHLIAEELSLLRQMVALLTNQAARPAAIAAAEDVALPEIQADFPTPGSKRLLLPRVAVGGLVAVAAAPAITLLCGPNHARAGGLLVNEGAKPVRVYLANKEKAGASLVGIGLVTLSPEGGSWNFKVADVLWAGSLCAVGVGGESNVDVTEV